MKRYNAGVAALLAILLAACGGGGGGGSGSGGGNGGSSSVLSLLAGNAGGAGNADGPLAEARFTQPRAMAMDAAGNLYLADGGNNTIRKITPGGAVTTLAGSPGPFAFADGTGAAARFSVPTSVVTDTAGNVYVADRFNHVIRKITPAGMVSTLAGSPGTSGSADGTGAAAQFNTPYGVVIDGDGNLYATDTANHTLRKITPAGEVSTLAGMAGVSGSDDGTGADARLNNPSGLAFDADGNLYVADTGSHTLRKITLAGAVTTLAGSPGSAGNANGTGGDARFNVPIGVSTDSANHVYVADTNNHMIRKITPAGEVTTFAGAVGESGHADGTGLDARFNQPVGLMTDGENTLYVADLSNHLIRKITPAGEVTTLSGSVALSGSTDGTGAAARFSTPFGVALDGEGNAYVTDSDNQTIRRITPAGVVTTFAGTAGVSGTDDGTGAAAQFARPFGAAADGTGNLYVADVAANTIRKITAAGVVSTFAGAPEASGSADGTGEDARFTSPVGVAVDGAGNVYVADTDNQTIRKITPDRVVTTVAGFAGSGGDADGTGSDARFLGPSSVAVDGAGNVYVADTGNRTIRKITPAGVVTTLAGTAGAQGAADGTGAAARFFAPTSVAVTSSGTLYVADDTAIRKVTPAGVVTTVVGAGGLQGFAAGPVPGALMPTYNVAIHGTSLYLTMTNGVAVVTPLP